MRIMMPCLQRVISCLVLCAALPGCGGGGGPTGTVNGDLTVKGSPAPAGTIITFASAESARTGTVGADGSFVVMGLPVGQYRISVVAPNQTSYENLTPEQAMMRAMENQNQNAAPPSDPIPDKYENIETSGITFEVQEGSNDFTLDLKE